MALKPTIYKYKIEVSDLNRNYFDSLDLTVAQHPSESLERLTARVIAYCLIATDDLKFTKGLSTTEEPDIWHINPDGTIDIWCEIGEPSPDRIKKASRLANNVVIYTFNSKSDTWWELNQKDIIPHQPTVKQLDWAAIVQLAELTERNMALSLTISEDSIYCATAQESIEIHQSLLLEKSD